MKNRHMPSKIMPRPGRFGSVMAGLVLLAITATSSWGEILPPQSHPYGHTYAEWSARWWQWSLEQSTKNLEPVSEPELNDGHVRFLAGSLLLLAGGAASVTNHITIPDGTPLFLSILSVWDDNSGCPNFTTFTAKQMKATVADEWTAVTVTSCTIDGHPVAGLGNPATTDYLVLSPAFSYTTAEDGNVLAGIFRNAARSPRNSSLTSPRRSHSHGSRFPNSRTRKASCAARRKAPTKATVPPVRWAVWSAERSAPVSAVPWAPSMACWEFRIAAIGIIAAATTIATATSAAIGKFDVVPGRREAVNPEPRDSGFALRRAPE